MAKKKVCCSFDYEHDRMYYNLLEAWNENDDINFSINAHPVKFKASQFRLLSRY